MFEAVGVTASEELIYRTLLRHPHAVLSELAALSGLSTSQTRRATAALAAAGLVSPQPGSPSGFLPLAPDVALGELIGRRQDELEQVRRQAEALLEEFRQATRGDGADTVVEIVHGREAIFDCSVRLLASAREEVLMFDKPPYLTSLDNPIEYETLARGVRWRALYALESLQVPDRMADLRRLGRAGEQARVAPDVPLKLAIADRRLALLPLTTDQDSADRTGLLVHPCSLLAALTTLFESLWAQSFSLPKDEPDEPDEPSGAVPPPDAPRHPQGVIVLDLMDRELLMLLAAGAKDEMMARQLNLSIRTVRRRIARLMHSHGASTRFQLGLVASRLGWL